MVAWNAAIGPSYKAGRWGYLDLSKAMHTAMVNPVTGFPVKYSQQHEDANMAAGRGMPAPFDNGVMRFGWVAPLVTNWMGDDGFLKRLNVQVVRPGLYGDLTTYSGRVTARDDDTKNGDPGDWRNPAGWGVEHPRHRGRDSAQLVLGAYAAGTGHPM